MKILNKFYKVESPNPTISEISAARISGLFCFGSYIRIFGVNVHSADAISGTSLATLSDGEFSPDELYNKFRSTYVSLLKLNRAGYKHRDINQGNLILSNQGLLVIDWEHATPILDALSFKPSKRGLGYPTYIAPYIYCDRYSLCKSVAQFLHGHHKQRLARLMKMLVYKESARFGTKFFSVDSTSYSSDMVTGLLLNNCITTWLVQWSGNDTLSFQKHPENNFDSFQFNTSQNSGLSVSLSRRAYDYLFPLPSSFDRFRAKLIILDFLFSGENNDVSVLVILDTILKKFGVIILVTQLKTLLSLTLKKKMLKIL